MVGLKKYFKIILVLIFILAVIALFYIYLSREEKNQIVNPLSVLKIGKRSGFKTDDFKPDLPSVKKIFSNDHGWTATLSAEKKRTVLVTGDIILSRMVNIKMNNYGDYSWPFRKTADLLLGGDITFANLEAPFVTDCPVTGEGMVFCSDPRSVEGLTFAGIDTVSLANNHLENYGREGLLETQRILDNSGILYTGVSGVPGCSDDLMQQSKSCAYGSFNNKEDNLCATPILSEDEFNNQGAVVRGKGNLAVKDIRGIKFGFLGYTEFGANCLARAEEDLIKKEVREAKKKTDILLVMFHWGEEYQASPSAKQASLAYSAIDFGADVILGNHPHWPQGVEIYKDKFIAYSHGNFVFDQMWSRETQEGVLGKYTFYDKSLIDVEFIPILIEDYGQPRLLEGEEGRVVLERMEENSTSY